MKALKIVIADDHPIVLTGIRDILNKDDGFEILAEVTDGHGVIAACDQFIPQLLLTDISMPKLNGLDAVSKIKGTCPDTKVVLMSIHHEVPFVKRALQLEVSGFVSKRENFDHLPQTLRSVMQGEAYFSPSMTGMFSQLLKIQDESVFDNLTRKEREVLQSLGSQKGDTCAIAKEMRISQATVRKHLQNIMDKLEIHSRWGLVQFADNQNLF